MGGAYYMGVVYYGWDFTSEHFHPFSLPETITRGISLASDSDHNLRHSRPPFVLCCGALCLEP